MRAFVMVETRGPAAVAVPRSIDELEGASGF